MKLLYFIVNKQWDVPKFIRIQQFQFKKRKYKILKPIAIPYIIVSQNLYIFFFTYKLYKPYENVKKMLYVKVI